MARLRDRMDEDLKLAGYSPSTIKNYLHSARNFAQHFTSDFAQRCRSADRGGSNPPNRNFILGFRPAMAVTLSN